MPKGNPPPITPAAFQVLLALARGRAHGYGIMNFVSELTDGSVQLSPGTLYRTLSRLAVDGLVEEAPDMSEDQPHDARRRYYQLTARGWEAAAREAELIRRLAGAAAEAGLLGRQERSA
ncbi:PadR family transcriptional regulator [Prauserella sp. PE36]|uniref:PadR family transcriptional regulator n=1 Tax=Prauserella endophytica TaxID=1592324 RepID=A0ABY2RXI4_9PSEU|nr:MULTISPECIES: PadR family transcriptional regulator [Prauserella]PXY26680.1 PadR family transcriptional regulator [Prauserella coralliicola]RBM10485.1 PadR family transcriptional regulator [Prauserella sp. PE36]TKG63823.1 PadR family transcriptional regulator [Prauserella endophytica]